MAPPHFLESRIHLQYSSLLLPRKPSLYVNGSAATASAMIRLHVQSLIALNAASAYSRRGCAGQASIVGGKGGCWYGAGGGSGVGWESGGVGCDVLGARVDQSAEQSAQSSGELPLQVRLMLADVSINNVYIFRKMYIQGTLNLQTYGCNDSTAPMQPLHTHCKKKAKKERGHCAFAWLQASKQTNY